MRKNIVALIIGSPGKGKTTYINRVANAYNGNVIYYDINREKLFRHFVEVSYKDLPKLKYDNFGSEFKVRMFTDNAEEFMRFLNIRTSNALVIFEDATSYINPSVTQEIRKLLTKRRHRNLDIFFTFHSLGHVPPFLFQMANYIEIFQTNDNINEYKRKIPNFDAVNSVYKDVNNNSFEHYHKTAEISQ